MLVKSVEKLVQVERFSAAAVVVDKLSEYMPEGAQRAEVVHPIPLSYEQICDEVDRLYPVGDHERDHLPDLEDSDPIGIVVTPEQILGGVEHLNRRSVSGSSGWTNYSIQWLFHDARSPLVSDAFRSCTRVVNCACAGTLYRNVARTA